MVYLIERRYWFFHYIFVCNVITTKKKSFDGLCMQSAVPACDIIQWEKKNSPCYLYTIIILYRYLCNINCIISTARVGNRKNGSGRTRCRWKKNHVPESLLFDTAMYIGTWSTYHIKTRIWIMCVCATWLFMNSKNNISMYYYYLIRWIKSAGI